MLVELHGQQDDKGLLDVRGHRALLDAFGALDAPRAAAAAAWTLRRGAIRALQAAETRLAELKAEEEFLRHAVAELDGLAPQSGEDALLDAARRRMQAAERVQVDIARAHAMIASDGAEGALTDAIRWLDGAAAALEGQLDPALDALARAVEALSEAEGEVAAVLEGMAFDARDLEETEERLFAIRALARKHGVGPDDLGPFAEDLRARLSAIDGGESDLADLRRARAEAEAGWAAATQALTAARREAAARLDAAMGDELAPLKMERALFRTEVTPGPEGPEGADSVTFTVATNPGAPAGPINKIASGGELSRFLLALKVCLTGRADGLTMIFDEIDRGVGGATADAVGRRLKALAEGSQVLVVTHSPQVAALGGHHWRVEKRVEGEVTRSTVVPLQAVDRIDEIARMLSGDSISDAAREAARTLLRG
jgi:DNA repair protein RecN (Recombination protein N)